jgi:hypothetical protein
MPVAHNHPPMPVASSPLSPPPHPLADDPKRTSGHTPRATPIDHHVAGPDPVGPCTEVRLGIAHP